MANRPVYYILDDKGEPVPIGEVAPGYPDLVRWGEWYQDDQHRSVAFDELEGGEVVSTIFTGIDTNPVGPPTLWETMAFDRDRDIIVSYRFTTRAEALRVHQALLEGLRRQGP